jgi:hypothetical protein
MLYIILLFKSTNMKTKMILLFAVVLAFSFTAASAQSYHDANGQQQLIKKNYKRGKLSHSETRELAYQQHKLRKSNQLAQCNNGQINRNQRARIMREQKMAGRNNYSYNHNNRSRF